MTNGDWIRSMNDEELATWLHNICHYEYGKDDAPYDGKFGHCRLECLKLKPEKPCCMYCTEADSCEDKCEDMNEYQYAGECPDYIEKEE